MWSVLVEDLEEVGGVQFVFLASPNFLDDFGVLRGDVSARSHRIGLVDGSLVQVSDEEVGERLHCAQALDS